MNNMPMLAVLLFVFSFALWAADTEEKVIPEEGEHPPQGVPVYYLPLPVPDSPVPVVFAPNSLLTPESLEQPLTQHYIRQYSSSRGLDWLGAVMRRGSIYIPFIREEIAKRNLPPELLYLPVIESGYHAAARSKSGATGLWQFMLNSIAPYNMKVNDMVDERQDFQKSTIAALLKLEENYRALGSWPLALAAYNAGLNGIKRVVQRTNVHDYWLLSDKKELKIETIHFVPKLLAVAWILSQPCHFDIDFLPEAVEWTTLPVGRQAALDIIAEEAGIDRELLRLGNMELLHGVTPEDKAYRLKVPLAVYPLVVDVLEREDLKLLRYYRYVVKYGDTLSFLAGHYGVSLNLIEQHNPGILNRYLKIGETIIIPALKETSPYTSGAAVEDGRQVFNGTYTVKKGDTLWSLALSYGIEPQSLAGANNMDLNQILPEGKALKVPIR